VIQTGQDPRRFVEDLLEHLRDLIVILSVGEEAKNVLRGIPADELEKMKTQALGFGLAELTHAAETVNTALTEMSGATSPKLHLELMCAKVLVPSSDQTEVGSLARIERLERRIGVGGAEGTATVAAPVAAPVQASAPAASAPATSAAPTSAPKAEKISEVSAPAGIGGVTLTQFKDSWPNILTIVNKKSKAAWMVAFALNVIDFTGDVLTLKFLSQKDLDSFKNANGASEVLRGAIMDVLGVQVKFKAQIDSKNEFDAKPEDAPAPVKVAAPVKVETTPIAVVEEPEAPAEPSPEDSAEETTPVAETKSRNSGMADESARYGESLLREMLGAEPMQDKNGK
jgi:DNA polymerase-3 subunit gamma/tau